MSRTRSVQVPFACAPSKASSIEVSAVMPALTPPGPEVR
jgi:hypothetical protein